MREKQNKQTNEHQKFLFVENVHVNFNCQINKIANDAHNEIIGKTKEKKMKIKIYSVK